MGIYVFKTEVLRKALLLDTKDNNKDIIPKMLRKYKIYGYDFNEIGEESYWEDVGTLDAYFEANMELVKARPKINLYDSRWPIRTYQKQFPPAKILKTGAKGYIKDSIISHGCVVKGDFGEKNQNLGKFKNI